MTTHAEMVRIETACLKHSEARDVLRDEIQGFQDEQEQIRRRRHKSLRDALRRYRETRQRLERNLDKCPHLFKKPKTRILHGLRVGYMKRKGKTIIKHPATTIAAIKAKFKDRVSDLISTKETVSKTALAQLTGVDLKRIGVEVTADTDVVVIKGTDSELDKLIKVLTEDDFEDQEVEL